MIDIPNCGYNSNHPSAFEMQHNKSSDHYLLLLVKTSAYFILDGHRAETDPNMAILVEPGYSFGYGAEHPHYNDDWIHFRFAGEEDLIQKLSIPLHTPQYIPDIAELSGHLRALMQDRYAGSQNSRTAQASWLKLILCHLDDQCRTLREALPRHKHYQIMSALRSALLNNPHEKWTVDKMAARVHMSPSYFQHLYKKLFGISCMQDVIQARMENAKFYLSSTNMSIQSLSDFLGYETDLHFMRQFKKKEGLTPSRYRSLSRNR